MSDTEKLAVRLKPGTRERLEKLLSIWKTRFETKHHYTALQMATCWRSELIGSCPIGHPTLPNELFILGLNAGEISVYSYLLYRRTTEKALQARPCQPQ